MTKKATKRTATKTKAEVKTPTTEDNTVLTHHILPVSLAHKQESSVELKRNSKGGVEVRVKVYNGDPEEAAKEAKRIFDDVLKFAKSKEA